METVFGSWKQSLEGPLDSVKPMRTIKWGSHLVRVVNTEAALDSRTSMVPGLLMHKGGGLFRGLTSIVSQHLLQVTNPFLQLLVELICLAALPQTADRILNTKRRLRAGVYL